jgi:DNA invertase Pin-like site-specific DNA recombinase
LISQFCLAKCGARRGGISRTSQPRARTARRTTARVVAPGASYRKACSSDSSMGARGDLDRLMADAKATPRPFDVVVVKAGDRIGRTGRAFWRWVWELEDLGIFVGASGRGYDNTTGEGRRQMRKDADYAEDEYEVIRSRTTEGLQEKAEVGGYTGGTPPYGFTVVNKGVKGESRLVRDDHETTVLHRAWELLVLDLHNCRAAARVLNAERLFKRKGRSWGAGELRTRLKSRAVQDSKVIYRNPASAGRKSGPLLDAEGKPVCGDAVMIELPAVFTPQELRRLNAALDRTARTPRAKEGIHPLSKRIIGVCGAHYTGLNRSDRSGRKYRCSGKLEAYPGAAVCSCGQIDADALEARVWTEVVHLLGDPERLAQMAEDWVQMAVDCRIDHAARMEEMNRQIETQRKALAGVMASAARTAAAAGLDPQTMIDEATAPLIDELSSLQKMLTDA